MPTPPRATASDTRSVPAPLLGRDEPLARLEAVADAAAEGRAEALVVSGHAGAGRTALLDASAARLGERFQVLRCTGDPSSRFHPFAGLHELLEPVAARVGPLSGQRPHLLATALDLEHGGMLSDVPPARIGQALVQFLSLLGEHRPVIAQVDDAMMLDPPSLAALRFAAARLRDDRVALVFSASPRRSGALAGGTLAVLELAPLDPTASAGVVASRQPHLPGPAVEELLAVAGGLPLALVVLPELLWPAESTDQSATDPPTAPAAQPDGPLESPRRWQALAQHAARHLAELSPEARLATLVVATEALDDRSARRALAALELPRAALTEALSSPLLLQGPDGPRLVHRSLAAVVGVVNDRDAPGRVHRAIAAVLTDPARRAHHLARTAPDDEAVAAAVFAATADTAARLGAPAVAGELFDLAARHTKAADHREPLLERAASAFLRARDPRAFAAVSDLRLAETRSDAQRGRRFAARVLAEERFALVADEDAVLERKALTVAMSAPDAAADLLGALAARLFGAGRHAEAHRAIVRAGDHTLAAKGRGAAGPAVSGPPPGHAAAPPHDDPAGAEQAAHDLHLALLRACSDAAVGQPAGTAWLDQHWERLLSDAALRERPLPACFGALSLAWLGHLDRAVAVLDRLDGLLGPRNDPLRARVLLTRARCRLRGPDWVGARVDVATATELALLAGMSDVAAEAAALSGWLAAASGAADTAVASTDQAVRLARKGPTPAVALEVRQSRAMASLVAGDAETAAERLATAVRDGQAAGLAEPGALAVVGDLCEAAWRARRRDLALDVLATYEASAHRAGRHAALAIVERSHALFDEEDFGARFERALALHEVAGDPFQRARTELCLAERLSHARRRREARPPLRAALATFEALGATAWAQRARDELEACGEHRRLRPEVAALAGLPSRQLRALRAIADGATEADVAVDLLVSRHTARRTVTEARAALGIADDATLTALVRPTTPTTRSP